MSDVRVASFNIHSCIGSDNIFDPARLAQAIRALDADVVCLQEVGWHLRGKKYFDQFDYLSKEVGYNIAFAPTKNHGAAYFGNAILSRLPIVDSVGISIAVKLRAPRGMMVCAIEAGFGRFNVVNAHFGLDPLERSRQAHMALAVIDKIGVEDSIFCGDFNEPIKAWLSPLTRRFGSMLTKKTFPAKRPAFSLDRIYVGSNFTASICEDARPESQRLASDHLPLCADVSVNAACCRSVPIRPSFRDMVGHNTMLEINPTWDWARSQLLINDLFGGLIPWG